MYIIILKIPFPRNNAHNISNDKANIYYVNSVISYSNCLIICDGYNCIIIGIKH